MNQTNIWKQNIHIRSIWGYGGNYKLYITISMGVCPTIKQEIMPSGKLTVRELENLHAIGKINELNGHFPQLCNKLPEGNDVFHCQDWGDHAVIISGCEHRSYLCHPALTRCTGQVYENQERKFLGKLNPKFQGQVSSPVLSKESQY